MSFNDYKDRLRAENENYKNIPDKLPNALPLGLYVAEITAMYVEESKFDPGLCHVTKLKVISPTNIGFQKSIYHDVFGKKLNNTKWYFHRIELKVDDLGNLTELSNPFIGKFIELEVKEYEGRVTYFIKGLAKPDYNLLQEVPNF